MQDAPNPMPQRDVKKKIILIAAFITIFLLGLVIWQEYTFNDGKLHLIFCDVGQGDGIFIRTPNKTDILLDGGPDRKVLDCLSSHMPFWDRTLELVMLSHPHLDHFAGFIDVIKSYTVLSFVTENLSNNSLAFTAFRHELTEKKITPRYLTAGNRIKTGDGVILQVLSPTKDFLAATSPGGTIGESGEFGSLIVLVSYGNFQALLTSDSQSGQLLSTTENLANIQVLQVAHHGSRTGLVSELLERLTPQLAVISVGKNNRYGHPHKEVLEILRDKDIKMLRTDQNGSVEITTDGKDLRIR